MEKNVFIETFLTSYLIPLLLTLFVSVIILLFINRFAIMVREFQNKKIERKINIFLPEIIFSELSENEINDRINKFKHEISLNSYWFKELLIKSLIEFKINLRDIDNRKIHRIYEAFSLKKQSYAFLKAPMIYFKKKGIYQIEKVDYKPAIKQVKKYIEHPNQKLSADALLAYIVLSERDISYLINTDSEYSFAEEIEILGICKIRQLKRPDLLKSFLVSENNFVVRLGLHLVVYYDAQDLKTEITACMYHKNLLVRKLAYIALGQLLVYEKTDEMLMRYPEEAEPNQAIIITSLSKIGNRKHLDFLKRLLLKGHQHQLGIARTIKSIDPAYLTSLALDNQKIKRLKKHIDEPLLK